MLLPISRGSQLSRAKKELSLERRKGAAGRMKMDPQVWHKVAAISGTSSNESLLLLSLFPFSSVTQNEKFTETGMAALGLGTYGAHGFKPQNPSYKDVCSSVSLFPQWLFTSTTSIIFFNLFICHFFFNWKFAIYL